MLLAVLLSCEKENSAPVPLPFQNHVTNAQLLCAHVHMRKIRLVLLKLPVLIALPAIPDQSGYLTICATRTNCASRTYLCYSQYLCYLQQPRGCAIRTTCDIDTTSLTACDEPVIQSYVTIIGLYVVPFI